MGLPYNTKDLFIFDDMISLAEENYLKALFMLSIQSSEVSINELSKELDIKMPTVTAMMKRFDEKGWVNYKKYKPVTLTSLGKKEAALIVRKHRLTEMFLVDIMGFGWEDVHEVAEQIEHIKSPLFFEKMDYMLNHPNTDPHGSPIPDKDGNIVSFNYTKLSQCQQDERVIFRAVKNESDEFLKYLNAHDLTLGVEICIKRKESFDNSMTIEFNDKTHILSQAASEKILVEKI